jgi:hypothetical protein
MEQDRSGENRGGFWSRHWKRVLAGTAVLILIGVYVF